MMTWLGPLCVAALLAAAPGNSPVADAAMRGDLEVARKLLSDGEDVNAPQGDGMTALHWAAERGDLELTKMLLYAGANVKAVTRIGSYTPLHLACQAGRAKVVEPLLKAGSDAFAKTTSGGGTALHFAAAAGCVEAIEALVDHGVDVNIREDVRWQTPLIFAASYGRVEAVKALLLRGAEVDHQTMMVDTAKRSALNRVARDNRNRVLKSFQAGEERPRSYTPAQVQAAMKAARAAQIDKPPEAEEEEEPVDMDEFRFGRVGGHGGLTALLHAAREGHIDVAMTLIDAGADVNRIGTGERMSPMLMATINGHFDLAKALFERGADPELASASGDTPLYAILDAHWAPKSTARPRQRSSEQQRTTYLELMQLLLEAGVDPNVKLKSPPPYESRAYLSVNVSGATPFWRAAYATDVDAMRLLVAHGADPSIATKNVPRRRRFSRGSTRGRGTAGGGNRPAAGGDPAPGQRRGRGRTMAAPRTERSRAAPSTERTTRGRRGEVRGGRAGGGDPRQRREPREDPSGLPPVPPDGPGVFPIHAASGVGYGQGFAANSHRHVPGGWLAAVRYLVEEHGADVNARDLNGYTPLHHAAARGDNELIRYLLEKGADPKAISRRGQSTADMANGPVQRVQIFPETVDLLVKHGARNTKMLIELFK